VAGEGRPAVEPFPGIRWTWEPAVCRSADRHELQEPARDRCPATHPEGASLAAWQPAYWSIRVWAWYPNPSGMFARANTLLSPFDDPSLPPGGFGTWDAWAQDADYSNRNHHVAGWIVLAIGGLMFLQAFQVRQAPWLRPAWTALAMLIGVLILRLRGTLRSRAWGLFLPALSITAGGILLQHQHAVNNFSYLGRANLPHVTEGLAAILIGTTKLLAGWDLWRGRLAAL